MFKHTRENKAAFRTNLGYLAFWTGVALFIFVVGAQVGMAHQRKTCRVDLIDLENVYADGVQEGKNESRCK